MPQTPLRTLEIGRKRPISVSLTPPWGKPMVPRPNAPGTRACTRVRPRRPRGQPCCQCGVPAGAYQVAASIRGLAPRWTVNLRSAGERAGEVVRRGAQTSAQFVVQSRGRGSDMDLSALLGPGNVVPTLK